MRTNARIVHFPTITASPEERERGRGRNLVYQTGSDIAGKAFIRKSPFSYEILRFKYGEDGTNRGIAGSAEHTSQAYYGTFQGVANYYPHPPQPPSQPVVGFPQPIPPPSSFGGPRYYHDGYQIIPVQGYVVAEGRPIREHRLPCFGLGLGWFLFIIGFFLGGVPWYIGAFILLCIRMDYREKAGLVACTVATVIALVAVTLDLTNKAHDW